MERILDTGRSHSLVLSPTGCVYIFGQHLQSDSLVDCKNPRPAIVKNLPPIASIAAGYGYSLFVDFDGNVWILGSIYAETVSESLRAEPV